MYGVHHDWGRRKLQRRRQKISYAKGRWAEMSMYDNEEKDELEYYISQFLENHTIAELLYIVARAIELN